MHENDKLEHQFNCRKLRIFSEIDEPLDFNETLVNGSVLNVVSIDKLPFFSGNHY